jgi:hypothetical protein
LQLNDSNPCIVARNLALLVLLLNDGGKDAIETVLHAWYAVAVHSQNFETIQTGFPFGCGANTERIGATFYG